MTNFATMESGVITSENAKLFMGGPIVKIAYSLRGEKSRYYNGRQNNGKLIYGRALSLGEVT